ncbi:WYL domain-containing protein [Thalassobacillus pellis]|uniref:WYL domain-containing protein n=1 Tax=Thalassobacillus pellis TaxID=748008 RepID=UPI00195F8C2A|nr:WYL domain-containing protein [Thalassobacillus pellis]MBM7554540.1 putative DNA-binding transcriptional regulator YafY [Thalassobacillus pellis]
MRKGFSLEATLSRMHMAMEKGYPVTIDYVKEDGTPTLRTIEIYACRITKAGNPLLMAMDRETQQPRSWRVDRIQTFTVHRSRYRVKR